MIHDIHKSAFVTLCKVRFVAGWAIRLKIGSDMQRLVKIPPKKYLSNGLGLELGRRRTDRYDLHLKRSYFLLSKGSTDVST
jgi:hypothetical protein